MGSRRLNLWSSSCYQRESITFKTRLTKTNIYFPRWRQMWNHLHKRHHESGGKVEVGHTGHQAGVGLTDVRRLFVWPFVWRLTVKAVRRRSEIRMLVPARRRRIRHPGRRNPLVWVVMRRRTDLWWEEQYIMHDIKQGVTWEFKPYLCQV